MILYSFKDKKIINRDEITKQVSLDIYGPIVSMSDKIQYDEGFCVHDLTEVLDRHKNLERITININSPGGNVFEGLTIYNALKRHKASVTVNIDGLCASIASVIAMAGDTVNMSKEAMMMIHNAMTYVEGNANKFREVADLLDKVSGNLSNVYLEKSATLTKEKIKELLDAETWLKAEEAKSLGLVDQVTNNMKISAKSEQGKIGKSIVSRYDKKPQRLGWL